MGARAVRDYRAGKRRGSRYRGFARKHLLSLVLCGISSSVGFSSRREKLVTMELHLSLWAKRPGRKLNLLIEPTGANMTLVTLKACWW